jgi:hypothetical protein
MFYRVLLILSLVFFQNASQAQNKVKGMVIDSASRQPMSQVSITNMNSSRFTISDGQGRFAMEASKNDILIFSNVGYRTDTFRVSLQSFTEDSLLVELKALSAQLATVKVQSAFSKYQLDSMHRREYYAHILDKPNKALVGQTTPQYGVGITFSPFGRYSKKEKELRNMQKLLLRMEEEAYVTYRFSPEIVAGYTGFKGDTLLQFMNRHRPGYAWARSHQRQDDILYYVNDQLKLFLNRKEQSGD